MTGDLTTLVNAKQYLGVTVTTDDVMISRLISAVSQYIQTWLNLTIAQTVYTETRDGTGGGVMSTRQYPVTSVTAVTVNAVAVPPSPDGIQSGFVFDQDRIALVGYLFNRGIQNVTVKYTAGYATTPFEIEQACIDMVAAVYKVKDRVGMSSKGLAGETTSFIQAAMTNNVREILNNYRQVMPV